MLQERMQVRQKAPPGTEVHSRCYDIWLLEQSYVGGVLISVQISGRLRKQLIRPLHSPAGDLKLVAILSPKWFSGSHNQMPFHASYSSLVQSQDLLHYNMACTIYPNLSIYIHTVELAVNGTHLQFEEHLESPIEWSLRCTGKLWLGEYGDALGWRAWWRELTDELGGHDRLNSEMHLEAVIEWEWICTWRPWSCEVGDGLGGPDRISSVMNLEAMIERVWRSKCGPWSSKLGGRNLASFEMCLEAIIEQNRKSCWRRSIWRQSIWRWSIWRWLIWRRLICRQLIWRQLIWRLLIWKRLIWRQLIWRQLIGRCTGSCDSIHWFTRNCGNVKLRIQAKSARRCQMRGWLEAWDSRSWLDGVLVVCCTWHFRLIVAWGDREGWLNFEFLGDVSVEEEEERDQQRWGKSSWETGTAETFECSSVYNSRYSRKDSPFCGSAHR